MAIDRTSVKKYFESVDRKTYYMFFGGLIGVFLFSSITILLIVSIALLGYSGYKIYQVKFNKPSDEQMDQWLLEDLQRLEPDSLNKARVDKSELVREPVMLKGPKLKSVGGAECYVQLGKDNIRRYSLVEALMIHFTEHQLITYQCVIDMITGNSLNVKVKRFFYKDVVSAETETTDYTLNEREISKKFLSQNPNAKKYIVNGKLQINGSESFRLTTSAGTAIEITLSIPNFIESNQGDLTDKLADQAIHSINKMLLSKKV